MDNIVTVYHGGIVETDQFSNVTFVGMDSVSLMFDSRPLLSELIARAREELEWNSTDDGISVVGYYIMVNQGEFLAGKSELHQRLDGIGMSILS